ncbi:class I SAM-dependent methyltransferase [Pseudomonadota bacterium]
MQNKAFDKYENMGAYHWRECDRKSRDYNPPLASRYQMIASRVNGGNALDLGAGDGYLAGMLSKKCETVTAIEYEPSGVQLARQMLNDYGNVEVLQGDTYSLPLADDQYDWVLMADVIEHLEWPEQAVSEMARVVSGDGTVLVTTPQWRPDRVWDVRHIKEYRPEELKDLLLQFFMSVELAYAWPQVWSDIYRTRLGWRLLKFAGRAGFNPFAKESISPEGYCQMLAICSKPCRRADR